MGLVDDEQGAVARAELAHRGVVVRVRQDDPDVGQRRLHENGSDVTAGEHPLQRIDVVEGHHGGGLGERHGSADVATPRHDLARVIQRRIGLIDGAVVRVVVHDDAGSLRHLPGVADERAVGIGRRERELPDGHPEALRHELGDDRRILRGQHERRPAGELSGDRRDRGGGRVPAHRPRVTEAEVDVVDAIEAGEVRPRRRLDVHRPRSGPLRHPEHRHAIGHVLDRALPLPLRRGAGGLKDLELALPEGGEARPIGVRHGDLSVDDPRLVESRRLSRRARGACGARRRTPAR